MEIFRVKVNANYCQWIMPHVKEEYLLRLMTFECKSKLNNWIEAEWYEFNSIDEECNFFNIGTYGSFAFDKKVYDSDLFPLLEIAGEIIPIYVNNKPLFIINILECIDALNENETKWDLYDDGTKSEISEYYFCLSRISESSLFKIPQTCKQEILTFSGMENPGDEFKRVYEDLGFTGLSFEKIFE